MPKAVEDLLAVWLCHEGHSWWASTFYSDYFKHQMFSIGIQDVTMSLRNPQTNLSERKISTVRNILRAFINVSQHSWTQSLLSITYTVNCSENGTIGMTRAELYSSRKFLLTLDGSLSQKLEFKLTIVMNLKFLCTFYSVCVCILRLLLASYNFENLISYLKNILFAICYTTHY